MFLVITLILALLFLPWPWDLVVIGIAALFEGLLATVGIRYTRRRRAQVGAQTMIGETAEVVAALTPNGQVKLDGAIWAAHADSGARVGERVRVKGIDGLTLEVEPIVAPEV